ncbi:MAG: hypothetical protein Q9190_001279 [Brigantiaea leucoxantha]
MPKAVKGVLVECDAAIKQIILKIDSNKHDYIVEDLDDEHVVIKESQLQSLKIRLNDVRKRPTSGAAPSADVNVIGAR